MSRARPFSTSALSRAAYYARTTVAPRAWTLTVPSTINARSVVFLSTPQNLPQTIENAIHLYQDKGLQVVVAGVDRTVPNGASNGVSELWLDAPLKIGRSTLLSAKDKAPPLRESDGINPVGAKVHWKNVEGNLHLDLSGRRIDLSLANTAFHTKTLTTLFYFQNTDPESVLDASVSDNMGQTLSTLHVKLPALTPSLQSPVSSDRWTPLTEDDNLIVTSCTGNLVKGINKQSAAQYLEKNGRLMSIASKDTKVYVKVHPASGEACKKYEVIAGGGGWGAKADLLAISPEAKLGKGDRLEFYMITPADRFASSKVATVSQQFLFECSPEATSYENSDISSQSVEHLFGGGSEAGFTVDGVNYKSPGESISFAYGQ